jgi:superfamily II DNA or RNA helicase
LVNLLPKQQPAVEALTNTIDGLLIAPCGSGKTVMGSAAMAKVGVTTIILVHKDLLIDQWQKAIEMVTGERAGIIKGGTWQWKGEKVVIAMLQTLHSQIDQIPEEFFNYFGLVISDEVHRISAPTWMKVIEKFPAKRRWGLTATPNRTDGLERIFQAHMGKPIYEIKGDALQPIIYMVKTNEFVATRDYINRRNGNANMAKLITGLTFIEKRNEKILRLVIEAAKEDSKIILLTDRVEHARFLKESFDYNVPHLGLTSSVYIGELNSEERNDASKADVIFATTQIAKEALDIPDLDTLFLATPFSSAITTQQAVGRILREYPGKKNPMVIDFVDKDPICMKLAEKRYATYERLGYQVKIIGG